MNKVFLLAASLLLAACQTSPTGTYDEPDDRMIQTGSHIPVKDKSAGKASSTADADALIRSQKVLGTQPGMSGGRSN